MKVHCLWPLAEFFYKNFSKFQKLHRISKICISKLSKENRCGEIVHFGRVGGMLKPAETNVFSANLNLRRPGSSVFKFSNTLEIKSGKQAISFSGFISSVVSMVTNSKIFTRIVEWIIINMINNKTARSIHNPSVKIQLPLAVNSSGNVIPFANLLRAPFRQALRHKSFVNISVNFCSHAF